MLPFMEYEMKATFGDGTVKTQEQFDKQEWIKQNVYQDPYIERTLNGRNPHNHPPAIRVKYLDREDIESCGWEFVTNRGDYLKKKHDHMMLYKKGGESKDGYQKESLVIDHSNHRCIITMWEEVTGENYEAFIGYIKNKSELLQIMKMIGIK